VGADDMTPLGSREKLLMGVIAVMIVVVVITAVFAFVPRSSKYSGDLNVHIDIYGVPKDVTINYTIFIDGHHGKEGNVIGTGAFMGIEDTDVSLVVKWSGNATHLCLVEVFCQGNRYPGSVWLADGLDSSLRFLIRL